MSIDSQWIGAKSVPGVVSALTDGDVWKFGRTVVMAACLMLGCSAPDDVVGLAGSGGTGGSDGYPEPGTGGIDGGTPSPSSGGSAPSITGGSSSTGGVGAGGGTGGSSPSTGGTGGGESCGWNVAKPGFEVSGNCYPQCSSSASTDSNGWGYENGSTCIGAGSAVAMTGTSCQIGGEAVFGECPPPGSFNCPGSANCGCEVVAGLGANKQALWAAGASTIPYMLASAMIETTTMSGTSYPYGDNKSGYAFNAGVCKQNWWMTSSCHEAWNEMTDSQYATSAAMNSDRSLDVQVYKECREFFGDNWWAYHRQGQSYDPGNSWHVEDVAKFKAAMDWTYCMLKNHFSDDIRFWVDVTAI